MGRFWVPAAVLVAGLAALVLYRLTGAPSITWASGGGDSGDLAVAVYTLGIPHPPGYPLYVLLGQVFVRLPTVPDPAGRLVVMSALAAALAVALAARSGAVLARRVWPAGPAWAAAAAGLAGAAAVGAAPLLWKQATVVEVNTLTALFQAAALHIALLHSSPLSRGEEAERGGWERGHGWIVAVGDGRATQRRLLGYGLLLGLAVGHHPTNGVLIWLLPLVLRGVGSGWRAALVRAGALAAAAYVVPYLYLPLRGAQRPVHAWGDPTTAAGLLDIVTGRIYQGLFGAGGTTGVERLVAGLGRLAGQLGPLDLLLLAVGVAALLLRARLEALCLLGLAATVLGFYAAYPARDSEVYLLGALLAASVAIAAGIAGAIGAGAAAARRIGAGRPEGAAGPGGRAATAALALALVAASLAQPIAGVAREWRQLNLSNERRAVRYATAALTRAAPGALVISRGDDDTFSLWYAREVLGLRPDVPVVDHWLLAFPWYREQVRRRWPELLVPDGADLLALAVSNAARRPVYTTLEERELTGLLRQEGQLYRVVTRR